MTGRHALSCVVNGVEQTLHVAPRTTLADLLRRDLRLTGTHLGCEHGTCGACTVLLDGQPVRSCLVFAVQVDGCEVRTVEGLQRDSTLHELQESFVAHRALQCGFCTPGYLMLAVSLLEGTDDPSEEEVEDLLASNLCRCTGYEGIAAAVSDCAARRRAGPSPCRSQSVRPNET